MTQAYTFEEDGLVFWHHGKGFTETQLNALIDYVEEVSVGPHSELCPLKHRAYRNKWCHTCKARELLRIKGGCDDPE